MTEKWQNRVHNEDRKTAYELDREYGNRKTAHGEPGHTGWKCAQCAMMATVVVSAFPAHDDDSWQNELLTWQEECDQMHSAKIDHLPFHLPNNQNSECGILKAGCIIYDHTPVKPVKQFERLGSRRWIGDD